MASDVTHHSSRPHGGDSIDRENYLTARAYLTRLIQRREQFLASRGRAVDFSKVSGGGSRHRGPVAIDPLEAWCVNVGWRLTTLGSKGASILMARCTRREKSAEASWTQIAAEVQDTVEGVKRTYAFAVAIFVLALEMDRIPLDLHDDRVILPQHAAEACAATLAGQRCAAPAA